MVYLSQRDPGWSSLLLGTSDKTIGAYGCTISALAIYLGVTPDVVNERLKAVSGFADGDLVIWGKIAEAFPGVSITKIGVYNNDEVLQHLPCLIEVDGAPIGGVRHWVVYIGNQQLVDPWDGQIKPTSIYTPLSYRFIQGAWAGAAQEHADYYKGLDLTNKDSMKVAIDVWARLQSGELVDKAQFETQLSATTTCQTQLQTAVSQNESLQNQVTTLQEQNKKLQQDYDQERLKNIALNEANATISNENQDSSQKAYEAEHLASDRGDFLHAIADEAGIRYDTTEEKKIVENVLDKIASIQDALKNAPAPAQTIQGIPQLGIQKPPFSLARWFVSLFLEQNRLTP